MVNYLNQSYAVNIFIILHIKLLAESVATLLIIHHMSVRPAIGCILIQITDCLSKQIDTYILLTRHLYTAHSFIYL